MNARTLGQTCDFLAMHAHIVTNTIESLFNEPNQELESLFLSDRMS
jgi:hypothetical protein